MLLSCTTLASFALLVMSVYQCQALPIGSVKDVNNDVQQVSRSVTPSSNLIMHPSNFNDYQGQEEMNLARRSPILSSLKTHFDAYFAGRRGYYDGKKQAKKDRKDLKARRENLERDWKEKIITRQQYEETLFHLVTEQNRIYDLPNQSKQQERDKVFRGKNHGKSGHKNATYNNDKTLLSVL